VGTSSSERGRLPSLRVKRAVTFLTFAKLLFAGVVLLRSFSIFFITEMNEKYEQDIH
jgi:hypothetical protein